MNVDQKHYIWMKIRRQELSGGSKAVTNWESVTSKVVLQGLSQNYNSLVLSDDNNIDRKPYVSMEIGKQEVSGRPESVTNSESVSRTMVLQYLPAKAPFSGTF